MINIFLLTFILIEILLFSYLDRYFYNTFLTPFNILAYPLAVVILIATFINPYIGFKPLSIEAYTLFIIGFCIFWTGGLLSNIFLMKFTKPVIEINTKVIYKDSGLKNFILVISWGIIISLAFSFYNAFKAVGGFKNLGTDQFAYFYAGNGINGHLLVLAILCIIYLVYIARKNEPYLFFTILCLSACIVLYQVKSWVYMTLVSCILSYFYRNNKIKIKLKYIILLIFMIFFLFEASYFFNLNITPKNFFEVNIFLLKHFTGYLVAGVVGISEHITQGFPTGNDADTLFAPFINMINVLQGLETKSVVSSYYLSIDLKGEFTSNVKTIFGTVLIYGGYFTGTIYILFLGFISYLVMIISTISTNPWYKFIYCFFLSGLFFGWFDLYFNILTLIEIPFFMFLLAILSRIRLAPEKLIFPDEK